MKNPLPMNQWIKLIKGFQFAFDGLREAFITQLNVKIHFVCTVLAVALGMWLGISDTEWVLLVLAIALVLSAELLNTAIEYLVDFISPGHHEKAGKVKDLAAGGVLIAATAALITGCIIFLPKLYRLWL